MSDQVHSRGERASYTVKDGAWCRGDQRRDLGVTVTKNGNGDVDHVSLTYRSLTPAAVRQLYLLTFGVLDDVDQSGQ